MANYKEDFVDIELTAGNIHRSFLNRAIGSGDNLADRFGIRTFRNGRAEAISGTCHGYFIRADGGTIALSNGVISGNTAYVTLTQECYAVEGNFALAIKVTNGGEVTTLRIVDGTVSRTSTNTAIDPGTIIPSIQDLIEAIDEAVASIPSDYSAICGTTRNLWINPTYNSGGVVVKQNADGSMHIQGTPSDTLFIDHYLPVALPENAYLFSVVKKGTATGQLSVYLRNQGNTNARAINLTASQTNGYLLVSYAPYRFEVVLNSGVSYNCDLYVQLEKGTYRTAWIRHDTAVDAAARENISELNSRNPLLQRLMNYKMVYEVTDASMPEKWGSGSGSLIHTGKSIHYTLGTAANGGFYLDAFSTSALVLQNTRIYATMSKNAGDVRLWMTGKTKGTGTDNAIVLKYLSVGLNAIDIDFTYYDVYSTLDISKPIRFLITNGGEQASDFTITDFRFMSQLSSAGYTLPFANEYLYQTLDTIMAMIPPVQDKLYLTSPNGNKWIVNVSNSGELSTTSAIPHKSAFIGNSLLMGWSSFGMAATDNEHDYYYHVTSRIHELDENATYVHLANGNLEHSTNAQTFSAAWDDISANLDSDLDLICIQLGDNVNTEEKITQFEGEGGSFDTMVGWIRTNCPTARLVWVGTWYQSIHDWLANACEENNIEFVDILPLATAENKAQLGDIIHRTENREQTLEGTYTESSGSLNITVTLYGNTYSRTVPSYTNVTDNGDGTFTMEAPYTVVDSTGVMSHPGNNGMLAIANAIMSKLGIS